MIFMKIEISGSPKEIDELVSKLQIQQRGNTSEKHVLGVVLNKLCDDFGLHDEETDSLIEKLIKE